LAAYKTHKLHTHTDSTKLSYIIKLFNLLIVKNSKNLLISLWTNCKGVSMNCDWKKFFMDFF
jgi:hypothetical protein